MKIKNRLTLIFTLIVAVILLCFNFYIYILSSSFTKNDFYRQLKNRAIITATVFLEADEESAAIINSFQKKYLSSLPQEIIRVYNEQNKPAFIDSSNSTNFNVELINKIRELKEYRQQDSNRQILGIYYKDNQGNFVIIASAVDESGIAYLSQLRTALFEGFFASLILVFFAGRYFTKLTLQPVAHIALQANKISETNLHLRLNEGNKKDELANLSITINNMLERLEHAFEMQKNFVANASHELRTPLTSIIGNIDVALSKARANEDYRTVLLSVMEEAEKLHKLTDGLLNLAQSNIDSSNLRKEEIRIDEFLFKLKDEIMAKRPGSHVEIILPQMPENAAELILWADANLLEIAFLNIIDNACKFSNDKIVTAYLLLKKDFFIIRIADKGIGINKDELLNITETFYRAENARSYAGSGIGLALAEKIVQLHQGSLQITSEINKGTEVSVTLPVNKNECV